MLSVEESLIDSITAVVHQLRTGTVPPPVEIPEHLPDNEIRQLLTYLNRFLVEFVPFAVAMEQIARGDLEMRELLGRMPVVQSLKALQSNLRHLTFKTQQIAAGDLEQRIDLHSFHLGPSRRARPLEPTPRRARMPQGFQAGMKVVMLGVIAICGSSGSRILWVRRRKVGNEGRPDPVIQTAQWAEVGAAMDDLLLHGTCKN